MKNPPFFLVTSGNNSPAGFKCKTFIEHKNCIAEGGDKMIFINYDYNRANDAHKNVVYFPMKTEVKMMEYFSDEHFMDKEVVLQEKIRIKQTVSKEDYIKAVKRLKEHIQQGDIYEINYCITFEARDITIDPFALYKKLNAISKAPYSAIAKINNQYIISSSPELFLSKRGNKLITKPIKGTAKRGATHEEDLSIKLALQNSLKERTENVMIVDVCRNDLSKIAKKGTVKVEKLYDIESYLQVHQMVSTVSCELKENVTFDDILEATFPMASMTGAPKIKAMELIDKYEVYKRGPYSGCLGYMQENGDFDLSVLIRSIFYDEEKKYLSFTVGSAITHLCKPEQEYEECLLKANAMLMALNAEIE